MPGCLAKIATALRALLSAICLLFISSCATPDLRLIDQDLGVTIPDNYQLVRGSSEPFGLGADADQTFIFQFDPDGCRQLEKAICNTPAYNSGNALQFDSFPTEKKLAILRTLADHKLSAYWVRSGSDYWFDGDSLFLNTHDNVISLLFSNKIILPNRIWKENDIREDGIPVYMIRARLDTRKRTLYYRYIHI